MNTDNLRKAADLLSKRDAMVRARAKYREGTAQYEEAQLCASHFDHNRLRPYDNVVMARFSVTFLEEVLDAIIDKAERELRELGVEL